MDPLSILVLGIVQGITEWLPISSKTIDTAVFLQVLGGPREAVVPLLLYLHLGTLLAAIIYFRSQLIELACAGWKMLISRGKPGAASEPASRRDELFFYVAALFGTGIVALPLLWLSKSFLANLELGFLLALMGAGLIVTALLLHSQKGRRQDRAAASAGPIDGLLGGLMQGLSVLPGLSRSGVTTTGLIWRGFDAVAAFELSFILSVPAVFCAEIVLWGYQLFADRSLLGALAIGDGLMLAAVSAVFGYLTIGALIRLARSLDFSLIAGAFGLLMLAAGLVHIG